MGFLVHSECFCFHFYGFGVFFWRLSFFHPPLLRATTEGFLTFCAPSQDIEEAKSIARVLLYSLELTLCVFSFIWCAPAVHLLSMWAARSENLLEMSWKLPGSWKASPVGLYSKSRLCSSMTFDAVLFLCAIIRSFKPWEALGIMTVSNNKWALARLVAVLSIKMFIL